MTLRREFGTIPEKFKNIIHNTNQMYNNVYTKTHIFRVNNNAMHCITISNYIIGYSFYILYIKNEDLIYIVFK